MTATTYEFTPEQNILLGHLASRMKTVGRVLMTLAVLAMAWAFVSASSTIGLEIGIVLGLLGMWSARAGAAFWRVVTTQGADVAYLMRGLGDLRKVYDLQFWFFIALAAAFPRRGDMRRLRGLPARLALIGALGFEPAAWAQGVDARQPEIPDSVIARGRKVYNGPANCVACHGAEGRGTATAPDLTDRRWTRGRGSYLDILDRVLHGVPRRESSTGVAMPMRGWSPASDDAVLAVAAYVWSLSHPRKTRTQETGAEVPDGPATLKMEAAP